MEREREKERESRGWALKLRILSAAGGRRDPGEERVKEKKVE